MVATFYLKPLTMLDALNSLRGLLKVHVVNIDNHVFRLHYKMTVMVLLLFWLLNTSRQFFGSSIECYFPDLPTMSLNTYCYIHSTFLVQPHQKNPVHQRFPHPGISGHTEKDTVKYYAYYQWVFVALLVQAALFYVPHHVWKVWEAGLMKILAVDLASPVYYGVYALLVNWKEGLQGEMENPMQWVFPTVTKCTFKKYGPSGSIEGRDGMCILPQNAFNQKIYVFLWFWFHILAAMSALVIMWRLMTLVFPSFRLRRFRSTCELNSATDIELVFHKLWIGDWFLLCMLQQNINFVAYKELIFRLARSCDSTMCSVCAESISKPCSKCTPV